MIAPLQRLLRALSPALKASLVPAVALALLAPAGPAGAQSGNAARDVSTDVALPFDTAGRLAGYLATGRDASAPQAYWRCTTNAGPDRDLRLFADGRGHFGVPMLVWRATGANRLEIESEGLTRPLRDVSAFVSGGVERFTARADDGFTLACRWAGRARNAGPELLDDPGAGLANLLTGTASNDFGLPWRCDVGNRSDGSVEPVTRTVVFVPGGFATLDGDPAEWFVDDRAHVVISTDAELFALDRAYADPGAEGDRFTARHRGIGVDCRRG